MRMNAGTAAVAPPPTAPHVVDRTERSLFRRRSQQTTASPRRTTTTNTPMSPELVRQRRQEAAARFSRLYAWMSFLGALLAIGLVGPNTSNASSTTTTTTSTPVVLMMAEPIPSSSASKLSAAFAAVGTTSVPLHQHQQEQQASTTTSTTTITTPGLWWLRKMMALPDQGQWKDPIHTTNNNNNNKETTSRGGGRIAITTTIANNANECRAATGGGSSTTTKAAWWHPFLLLPMPQQHHQKRESIDAAAAVAEELSAASSSCVSPIPPKDKDSDKVATPTVTTEEEEPVSFSLREMIHSMARAVMQWLDPTLLQPFSGHTLTDLIDKILTSTPRLLAISNFLLTLTYIVHSVVADWFLVQPGAAARRRNQQQQHQTPGIPPPITEPQGAREKMGGFLVFKLLLISAVLTPDTLDLLILLSWYTLLSFLRSLAHLAAHAIHYSTAAGQAPSKPVLHLLYWVGLANALAAVSCVALFKAAGIGMVILLTCDCALTALYVTAHILQHLQATWEVQHADYLAQLEQQQQQQQQPPSTQTTSQEEQQQQQQHNHSDANTADDEDSTTTTIPPPPQMFPAAAPLRNEEMEQRIQVLEQEHNRRIVILETIVFYLQLAGHLLTVLHFVHIWTLHGIQFTLIDGVLCLHLHSAISAASRKICQRRNMYRIARDLDDVFSDATELELRKAHDAGDVCCVCLSSMTMHVKKVACGHLYHTSCLREVVERARTMEAAKCPLCRASLLDGHYHNNNNNNNNNNANDANVIVDRALLETDGGDTLFQTNNNNNNNAGGGGGGEQLLVEDQALFRLSTEGLIPSWLHIPSVSFEVVRRAPLPSPPPPPMAAATATTETVVADNTNTIAAAPQQQQSWFRRFLIMAGAIPMTPEEEAVALEQLVDMFPQYDRADLLRELRERSSAEAVAESILSGSFSGAPR